MSPAIRSRPPARWPFWLLLVAWFCANTPQGATYALLSWLDEARHFSHQQRLIKDVALVLGGERAPGLIGHALQTVPAQPRTNPMVAEMGMKKIDLAVENMGEPIALADRAGNPTMRREVRIEVRREAPLTEPPRVLTD